MNTPIIGIEVDNVASSRIDMLAGLSRWYTFSVPPGFCAKAGLPALRTKSRRPAARIARMSMCTLRRPKRRASVACKVSTTEREMMAELEAKRVRLAAVERELAELDVRHELVMSAFKFDEAREVQQRIAALERERGELIDALPPLAEPPPAPAMVRQDKLLQRRLRARRRR